MHRPGTGTAYCVKQIGLSVCLHGRQRISGTTRPVFTGTLDTPEKKYSLAREQNSLVEKLREHRGLL